MINQLLHQPLGVGPAAAIASRLKEGADASAELVLLAGNMVAVVVVLVVVDAVDLVLDMREPRPGAADGAGPGAAAAAAAIYS